MKVEILEKIWTYKKGEIIEMREDLVKWVFKDKVKVLEEKKEIKTAKNKAILKPKNTK